MATPPPRRSKAWLSRPCLRRGDVTREWRCLDLLKQMENSGGTLAPSRKPILGSS